MSRIPDTTWLGAGEVTATDGPVASTVKPWIAGVGSVLPAASVARTARVCGPLGCAARVCGELHTAYGPPSTAHSKVEVASVALNVKSGVVSLVVVGPERIVVSGGVVSPI